MPDTATAPTATNAQTRAAGTRMLGYYLGGGGAKVDALIDPANFLMNNGAGEYQMSDAQFPRLVFERAGIGTWSLGYDGTPGSNAFSLRLNGSAPLLNAITNGNIGIGLAGAAPASRLHIKSSSEIARFESPSARGGGNGFIGFADAAGRKAYFGYGGLNDVFNFANEADGGIIFATNNVNRWQIANNGHFYPQTDNAYSVGAGGARITQLHAATNVINTCDIRLKFYRAEPAPSPDEHAAVLEVFDVFGFFQHLDAIAREEDGGAPARWHFGPKAQEVWAIFASHGLADDLVENEHGDLVPPEGSIPPAFLCFDAWDEETAPVLAWWRPSEILGPDGEPVMVPCAEGEEGTEKRPTGETYVVREAGNIFGIRTDQLQSLMLVALNKERKAQAAEIAALAATVAALAA